MRSSLLPALFAALALAACDSGQNGGAPADAGAGSPVGSCQPTAGAPGNSKHVGAYCTNGGGQCGKWPAGSATSCASELDPRGGNFCILLGCALDTDCGES